MTRLATMDGRPALRGDLVILPQRVRGQAAGFIIRDPRNDAVFELKAEEYFLCEQMDGATSLEEIRVRFESRFGHPVSASTLETFVGELEERGLLTGSPSASALPAPDAVARQEKGPIFKRALFYPDRFLGWLAPKFKLCFTRPVFVGSMLFVALALYVRIWFWSDFSNAVGDNLEENFLIVVLEEWTMQVVAACVQGLAVKVCGGRVSEIMLKIPKLLPRFYCEFIPGAWLSDKSNKFAVRLAPILFVVLLWVGGILGWWLNTPGTYRYTASLMSATAAEFWFWLHLAPLRPGEGYQLLVTWLEMPHLYQNASTALRAWLARRLPSEPWTRRERMGFIVFGLSSIGFVVIWNAVIFWGYARSLTDNWQGIGGVIFLALMLYLFPIGRHVWEAFGFVWEPSARQHVNRIVRVAIIVVAIIVLFLPYPYNTGGTFKILPVQKYEVHLEIGGGLVTAVPVKEGQWVRKGEILAQIDEREYRKNLDTSQAELAAAVAKRDLLRKQLVMLTQPPNIEQIQQIEAEVRRLEVTVQNAKRELALTTFYSPIDGRVITPHIDQKVGQFLKKGDLFAIVQDARTVEVEISVPEADAPDVQVGAVVRAVPWAYPDKTFPGKVLSTAAAANEDADKSTVVQVLAQLPNADELLKSDMTGYAKIKAESKPVWVVFTRRFLNWIRVEVWSWVP